MLKLFLLLWVIDAWLWHSSWKKLTYNDSESSYGLKQLSAASPSMSVPSPQEKALSG